MGLAKPSSAGECALEGKRRGCIVEGNGKTSRVSVL